MDTRSKLLHAITQCDIRQSRKPGYNRYALGIMIGGLQVAMEKVERGVPLRKAIVGHFNGRLLDALLKAIGEERATIEEVR